jgi:hypothetical protein
MEQVCPACNAICFFVSDFFGIQPFVRLAAFDLKAIRNALAPDLESSNLTRGLMRLVLFLHSAQAAGATAMARSKRGLRLSFCPNSTAYF